MELLGRGKPPHDVKTVAITQYVRDLILQGEKLERKDANRKRPNAPAKAKTLVEKLNRHAKGKKGKAAKKAAKKAAAAPVETAVEVATEVAPAPEAAASEPTAADVEGITGDLSGD